MVLRRNYEGNSKKTDYTSGLVKEGVEGYVKRNRIYIKESWICDMPSMYADEYFRIVEENLEMTKDDLKTGMWIEEMNGNLGQVFKDTSRGDIVSGVRTWYPLKNVSDEALFGNKPSDYKVRKVYDISINNMEAKDKPGSLIWQREEKSEAELKIEQLEKEKAEYDCKFKKQIEELKKEIK